MGTPLTFHEPHIVRGPLLNPGEDGQTVFYPDGALLADPEGRLRFAGEWRKLEPELGSSEIPVRQADGIITPPFLDCHTHIPQFPIRGHFLDGLPEHLIEGRLLAGLARNVFPQEGRCREEGYAAAVVRDFAGATQSHGVVGGAAYMTVHAGATRVALQGLGQDWCVGLVLMNQNCPVSLRTDEPALESDTCALAAEFGSRLILTDRFAVSVDTPLRRRAVALSLRLGLRMQTHLNEQRAEKALVENVLYPGYRGYTDVYRADGLLDRAPLLAHCVQMRTEEWEMLARNGVAVAHCPTSNTLLGSGTMPLAELRRHRIPYALCTDVGASPTPSMLAEMAQFLKVHRASPARATPSEALYRATLAPAQILGLDRDTGSFEIGKRMSFLEIAPTGADLASKTANEVIWAELLERPSVAGLEDDLEEFAVNGLDHGETLRRLSEDARNTADLLDAKVLRVTVAGETVWQREREKSYS